MPAAATSGPAPCTTDTDTVTPGEVDAVLANLDNLVAELSKVFARTTSTSTSKKLSTKGSKMTIPETVMRLCEYTNKLIAGAFGGKHTAAPSMPAVAAKPAKPAKERFRKRVVVNPAVVEKGDSTGQPDIAPFDAEFQTLQSEMRKLLEKAEEMRGLYQRLSEDNDALDLELDKLDARMIHCSARARVRHIRFITQLEEVWAMEPDDKCHCPLDAEEKMARCCEAT